MPVLHIKGNNHACLSFPSSGRECRSCRDYRALRRFRIRRPRGRHRTERLQLVGLHREGHDPELRKAVRHSRASTTTTTATTRCRRNCSQEVRVTTSSCRRRTTWRKQIQAGMLSEARQVEMPNLKNLDPVLMKMIADADPGNAIRRALGVRHRRYRLQRAGRAESARRQRAGGQLGAACSIRRTCRN